MKIQCDILFKNGVKEKIIVHNASEEEIEDFNRNVKEGFTNNTSGVLTLGDGKIETIFVRLDDVSRISMKIINENDLIEVFDFGGGFQ
ncbi:hypothetical protein [Bacillus smithii]|uniref:hypothetical protein n=1 Tax=Bacillus smithii TaxID=1479 RepID=UPI003D1988A1